MSRNVERETIAGRRSFMTLVGLAGAAGILPFAASAAETRGRGGAKPRRRSEKTSQTAAALRDLWVGHIFWVRNVALATFGKDEAAMAAAERRAVANAQSLAASIAPFYGVAAGERFFQLLAGHYGAVKAYLAATAGGDASAQSTATQSLTSNAEEIAVFLSKANPYLPKDALHGLLLAHGGHHIQQIQELTGRRYDAEARTWEDMKSHVYQIADATAEALARQFPRKFR